MPMARKYATNADRQVAYRQRCAQRRSVSAAPAPTGGLPGRRWHAVFGQAHGLLAAVAEEMAHYWDARSEAWQDSERGERFTEKTEALEEILDRIHELMG